MSFDTNLPAPMGVGRPPVTWALVPLKSSAKAKSRLAATLSDEQRSRVFNVMAQGVIAALRAARGIHAVAVVTASPEVAAFARQLGALPLLQEEDQGMSAALSAGLDGLQSMKPKPERVLMLPGDLPLITPGAVEQVLSANCGQGVVIVPDRQRLGTNALLCHPPHLVKPRFGERSFERHLAAARAAGVRASVADVPELALDLDCPDDLEFLIQHGAGRAAAVFEALRLHEAPACAGVE